MVFVLIFSTTAFAKDYAVIYSYDCNPTGQWGHDSENEIAVLKNWGWNILYYCGNEKSQSFENSFLRDGALTTDTFRCGLKNLDLKSDDNLLVIINTHGDMNGIGQAIELFHAFSSNESSNRKIDYLDSTDYMGTLYSLKDKNKNGKIILVNRSCFSGRCIGQIPPMPNLCVVTAAPEDTSSITENFWSIAFQNLPGSKSQFHKLAKTAEYDMEDYLKSEDSPFEYSDFSYWDDIFPYWDDYLRSIQSKIEFSSSKLGDILSIGAWFDRYTPAFYTDGFKMNDLNISDDLDFIGRYSKLMENFSPEQKANATSYFLKYKKRITTKSIVQTLPDPLVPHSRVLASYANLQKDFETHLLRNQLMSFAFHEIPSDCGNFDLNRNQSR